MRKGGSLNYPLALEFSLRLAVNEVVEKILRPNTGRHFNDTRLLLANHKRRSDTLW